MNWPYNSLLLDESRGILLRYCIDQADDVWRSCVGAINASSGETLWEKLMPGTAASLSLATGVGVLTAVTNTINPNRGYITRDTNVSCMGIDVLTGKELWSWPWPTSNSEFYGWSLVDGEGRLLVEKQVNERPDFGGQATISFLAIDSLTGLLVEESTPYVDTDDGFGTSTTDYGMRGMPFQLGPDGRPYGWIGGVPSSTGQDDDGGDGEACLAALRPLPPSHTPSPRPSASASPGPSTGPSDPIAGGPWQLPVAASVGGVALLSMLGAGACVWRRKRRAVAEDEQALLPDSGATAGTGA